MLLDLFAHLFFSRHGPFPVGAAALEDAAATQPSPRTARCLTAPEAPGDCFPHVIIAPLSFPIHARGYARPAPRASVGKFPHITEAAPTQADRGGSDVRPRGAQ
jgi:hypothetical protein